MGYKLLLLSRLSKIVENNFIKNILISGNSILFAIIIGFRLPLIINDFLWFSIDYFFVKLILSVIVAILTFIFIAKVITEKQLATKGKVISENEFDFESNHFDTNQIVNVLLDSNFSGESKKEFVKRLEILEKYNSDNTFIRLKEQYDLSIENERFYEKTIWQIASIFIPVSLTLTSFGFGNNVNSFQLIIGFLIYLFFLILFQRFRLSIRLNRDYSLFLENILGLFTQSYVYKYQHSKYGMIVRVWTILVNFGLLYLTVILNQIFK